MASRVGFVILSHRGTDWPLLARLFPRLRELPEASIALHHDTYQSPLNRELIERYDVQVVPAVGRTSWSNIINVFATVAGLEVLFRQPRRPRWYVTLSQSCYPIKSASHIAKILDGLTDDFYIDMRLVNSRQVIYCLISMLRMPSGSTRCVIYRSFPDMVVSTGAHSRFIVREVLSRSEIAFTFFTDQTGWFFPNAQ
jgi:hypothetical protein